MSYAKYTTFAFIVSLLSKGEADMLVVLYTKDFGLIKANAKSVRLEKSKLRSNLEEGNLLSVSLVKGREIWRLTEANIVEKIGFPSEPYKSFLRILSLIKQLVHGEEINKHLFNNLEEFFNFVLRNKLSREELDSIECITVSRILNALGYGGNESDWQISITEPISKVLLSEAYNIRSHIVLKINKSLKETHLQ